MMGLSGNLSIDVISNNKNKKYNNKITNKSYCPQKKKKNWVN